MTQQARRQWNTLGRGLDAEGWDKYGMCPECDGGGLQGNTICIPCQGSGIDCVPEPIRTELNEWRTGKRRFKKPRG